MRTPTFSEAENGILDADFGQGVSKQAYTDTIS